MYHDADDDGKRDPEESALYGALVEVFTYPAGVWVAAFTTADDGRYTFDLAPGAYQIEETRPPSGYVLSTLHYVALIRTFRAGQRVTWDFPNGWATPTATPTFTPTVTPVSRPRAWLPVVWK